MLDKDLIYYLDDEKKYPIVFTINVIEELQARFGDVEKAFADLEKKGNIADFKTFISAMMSEAIDILNENGGDFKEFSGKQIGRILTCFGVENCAKKMAECIVNSMKIMEFGSKNLPSKRRKNGKN